MAFFDLFPRVAYDIEGQRLTKYESVTNIFFRLRVIREVLTNISAYYEHTIADSETPEILAEKIYRDAGAYWIILMANDIVDPQYDWPLDDRSFRKYMIDKYGSIQTAKTTYHHYEKVVERTESFSGLTTETRFIVNQANVSSVTVTVPFDSYASLPETQFVETFNMPNNRTVTQITRRDRISNWDYEKDLNEKKRLIKVIKPEYYSQIVDEFNALTNYARSPFLRRLI